MNWREQAACRSDPDLWFSAPDRPKAIHICRTHCPVVEQCAKDAIAHPPREGVQAGVAFNHLNLPFPPRFYTPVHTCDRCVVAPGRKPPTPSEACGTLAGYRRHLRQFEEQCEPCRLVRLERQREWRAKSLARAAAAVREEKE